jgi:hypothetical protein
MNKIRFARLFWEQQTKVVKNIPKVPQKFQKAIKYTKIALKIPNGHDAFKNPRQNLSDNIGQNF